MRQASAVDASARSVIAWLDRWQSCIRERNLPAARTMFRDDVVAFGTYKDRISGLDDLVEGQWTVMWSSIEDFTFLIEEAIFFFSSDGLLVCVTVPWTSYIRSSDGARSFRPGRSTILLQRSAAEQPWLAGHTHFSLNVSPTH